MKWTGLVVACLIGVAAALAAHAAEGTESAADIPKTMNDLPLVFHEDFAGGSDRWVMTDPNAWAVEDESGNKVLHLKAQSAYEPPVRSPKNIARVKDLDVSDFVLEVRMKQTGKEYGHRDMCVFFGYTDPAHFYYVHMATKADEHANSVFLVNGEPRVSIADKRTDGTDWGQNVYHTVRIIRNTETGVILVFFNDMETPIMKAEDKTFLSGGIGFGSFDDTGKIDDVTLWAKTVPAKKE